MKLTVQFEGVFLGSSASEWKNFEKGTSGMTYKVSVKQGGGVGEIKCEKEVFDMYVAGQIPDLIAAVFVANVDDRYGQIKVVAVQPKGTR